MSLEPVVEELDVRLRKIEHMVSLLCDKVGMAHEAALPPGKRRRPDPEVTAPPCGSRGSEDLEEDLELKARCMHSRRGKGGDCRRQSAGAPRAARVFVRMHKRRHANPFRTRDPAGVPATRLGDHSDQILRGSRIWSNQ